MRGLTLAAIMCGSLLGGMVATIQAQEVQPDFFADRDVLEFILHTDLSVLLADRSLDSPDRPAEVGYVGPNNTPVWLPVQVKTRGNFRLVEDVCEFPPLSIDFRARHLRGTLFDGQNTFKVVTHCQQDPAYQHFVILEYLAYRLYELLTPKSFRTRLAKVTYADVSETLEPATHYAFLIEDIDDVAIRHRTVEVEFDGFHALLADDFEMGVLDVFQFMIGNTDWSTLLSQNVKFIQDLEGNTTVIPFDFDWSGVVAPPYAYPAPDVPISSVRERYYMGVCRVGDHLSPVFDYFVEKKDEIYDLYRNEQALGQEQLQQVLAYFDEFYEIITDERLAQIHIRDACKL
jgi:hypothetical protein